MPVANPSPIARYLAGLSAEPRGPHRVRADLLAEARDGLVDATGFVATLCGALACRAAPAGVRDGGAPIPASAARG